MYMYINALLGVIVTTIFGTSVFIPDQLPERWYCPLLTDVVLYSDGWLGPIHFQHSDHDFVFCSYINCLAALPFCTNTSHEQV